MDSQNKGKQWTNNELQQKNGKHGAWKTPKDIHSGIPTFPLKGPQGSQEPWVSKPIPQKLEKL